MLTHALPIAPRLDVPHDAGPVATKLGRLESKPSLDLDAVDYELRRPAAVRARLAAPLMYSQRVEAMVTGLSIETLLPRTGVDDDYIHRFLAVWTPDEQGHALALERLLITLDLAPFTLPQDEPVPVHNRIVGLLGSLSTRVHETVELVYHSIGAMNERLAFSAYERMSEILSELGELRLVETLMKPLRRDESAHLGYYRTAARDLRDRLDSWQLAVARSVISATYAPVGAGRAKDKPAFGATLQALGDSRDLVDRVQLLAESLLSVDDRRLRPFVQRSFERCSSSLASGELVGT
ncbi:MAG: hypothetical protein ACJ739_09870 [Acidimicrobiales bacterium]